MMRRLFCPGLFETGPVRAGLWAIRAGWVNFFAIGTRNGLACFDAGGNAARAARGLALLGRSVEEVLAVFLTHAHWDHAGGVAAFPRATIYAGKSDCPSPRLSRSVRPASWVRLRDGETVTVDGLSIRAHPTPGHTPGSCSYVADGGLLFTGDTIRLQDGEAMPFAPWLGRNRQAQLQSLRRLAGLNGLTHLLTAHTGGTADPAAAFRRWRGPSPA